MLERLKLTNKKAPKGLTDSMFRFRHGIFEELRREPKVAFNLQTKCSFKADPLA